MGAAIRIPFKMTQPDQNSVARNLALVASNAPSKSDAICELRKLHKRTLTEAGAVIGRTDGGIQKWESGKTWPEDVGLLKSYLVGLGIDETMVESAFGVALTPSVSALSALDIGGSLDALVGEHKGDVDYHDFARSAFKVGMPAVLVGLVKKAASGEVAAARLLFERFDDWQAKENARTVSSPIPVASAAKNWIEQSLPAAVDATEEMPPVEEPEGAT